MKSNRGFPHADDPAYKYELDEMWNRCLAFGEAMASEDFDAAVYGVGELIAQGPTLWKLAPPTPNFNPAQLFFREEIDEC